MEVIKAIVEDGSLSPVEKVLFSILYCRREGDKCHLSMDELVRAVGVELQILQETLQNLEEEGFIKINEDCQITDATSFLSCAVLGEKFKSAKPSVPRP